MKVLYVEDNDDDLYMLKTRLELLGDFEVLTARNGEKGCELAVGERPDIIIMDLEMPVMDGWEATRKIKANPDLKHIPIIAVTSHAMVGDEIQAREAGCDDYLPKPVDEEILIQKIKKFIG